MDLSTAKTNMITQQIRAYDITDEAVINLFSVIDRAAFVDEDYQDLAYADMMLPINCDQVMLSPKDQAKLLQALKIKPTDTVLEIGTGNGFLTALLSKLAKNVISVEIHAELHDEAKQHLERLRIHNVDLQIGNAASSWELKEPVDVIMITGALPYLPESFKACIKENGKIISILGDGPAMQVVLHQQENNTPIFEVNVPMLEKALQPERFTF